MKCRIITTLCVFWGLLAAPVLAQNSYANKIKPGEQVPDVSFPILENGKMKQGKVSDYRGRLLILDYWNIWCSSCIAAFPKLERLQQQFGDKIMILPVSFLHTQEVISSFLKKREKIGHEIKLPLAILPDTANELFRAIPTFGYPFEVWIDAEGKLILASDASDVTEANIKNAVNNQSPGLKSRNWQMDFKASKPFLTQNNGGPDTAFVYRSLISKGVDSIPQYSDVKFSPTGGHIFLSNKPAINLIKYGLKKGLTTDLFNRYVVIEDAIKSKFLPESGVMNKEWIKANWYCYDLTLPPGFTKEQAFCFMQEDLERFFGIKATEENHDLECLVLKRLDSFDRIKSKKAVPTTRINNGKLEVTGRTIDVFLAFLATKDAPIMIDETAYKNPVDITINKQDKFDLAFYNNQLKAYGLMLEPAVRNFPVVIIIKR